MNNIIHNIKSLNIGKVIENAYMNKYSTYKAGGKVLGLVFPNSIDSFITLLKYCKDNNIKFKIVGYCSNILFSDDDYDGIIIKMDEFDEIKFLSTNKIKTGAGVSLVKISNLAAKHGLTGLEFASGIPGSVGGAVYMNAGAYKSDMGYVVEKVKVLTPSFNVITFENKELDFHYRSSFFQKHKNYYVLEVYLKLKKGKKEAIEQVIKDRKKRRIESQPLEYPSAGSVFRNPEGMFAGELIEKLGLKGKTKGGAMISDKHANFVINKSRNAKAEDIKYLIDLAHDKVLEKYKVDMKIEQEFFNFK